MNRTSAVRLFSFLCLGAMLVTACAGEADPEVDKTTDSLGGDTGTPPTTPDVVFDVPPEAGALLTFLEDGGYTGFPAESAVHGAFPGSPHGDVRVFANPVLDTSLAEGATAHPAGSASVKELYDVDGVTLIGWAVSVKTDADSAGGAGWYWYQIVNDVVAVDGNGIGGCTGCHDKTGIDFFSTPYPLQ